MRHVLFILSLLLIAATGYGLASGFSFLRQEFPDVTVLRTQYPVVHYMGRDREPRITLRKTRPDGWISVGDVSKTAVGAIIVSEDWAFYQHKGYDANQIKEAIKDDWEAGRLKRGASTITQQVVKNVFLEKDKNLWRKLKELMLAVRMEDTVGKRRILETYLNIAEWGEGLYGIGPAARHYFGKHPSQLTAKEGAFLAMLLPSPRRYSQSFRSRRLTDYARETVESILEKMEQARYITEEERRTELELPFSFEEPGEAI
jgi:monofunctional biosynthetic peptidoglycan transglycosylase